MADLKLNKVVKTFWRKVPDHSWCRIWISNTVEFVCSLARQAVVNQRCYA